MGYNTALDFADLDLEQGIAYHLQGNHYPPVPLSMVQPCIDAIDAFYDEDYNKLSKCLKACLIVEKSLHPPPLLSNSTT